VNLAQLIDSEFALGLRRATATTPQISDLLASGAVSVRIHLAEPTQVDQRGIPTMRALVLGALKRGPLTVSELAAAVAASSEEVVRVLLLRMVQSRQVVERHRGTPKRYALRRRK
jgi:hypothetical protein